MFTEALPIAPIVITPFS